MAFPAPAPPPPRPRPAGARPLPALPISGPSPAHHPPSSSSYDYEAHGPAPNGFSLRPPPLPTARSLSASSAAVAVPPPPSRPNLSLSVSPPQYLLNSSTSTTVTSFSSSGTGSGSSSSSSSLNNSSSSSTSSSSKPRLSLDAPSSSSASGRQPPAISLHIPSSSFGPRGNGFAAGSSNNNVIGVGVGIGGGIPNGGLQVHQPKPKPSIPRLNLSALVSSVSHSSLRNPPHPATTGYGGDPKLRRKGSDAGSTGSSGSDYEYEEDEDVGYYGRRPALKPLFIPAGGGGSAYGYGGGNTDAMPTLRPDQNTMRPGDDGPCSYHHASHKPPASMDDVRRAIEESNAHAHAQAQQEQHQQQLSSSSSPPFLTRLSISTSDMARPPSSSTTGTGSTSSNPSPPTRAWTGDDSNLEILARLGEGASGAVFKVRDTRNRVIMAQKTVPATSATNPKALLHEYKSLSGSMHENITTFYGAFVGSGASTRFSNGESDGVVGQGRSRGGAPEICLLMEYCEGGSLDGVARRIRQMGFGRVSEKVMGKIAPGILQGLNYLHSKQVIHRGKSPHLPFLS